MPKMAQSRDKACTNIPKDWDIIELRIFDSLASQREVREADLTNQIHEIFLRERWDDITDAEWALLLPSMRLATRLLEVGMPYLVNFLPSAKVHAQFKLVGLEPRLQHEDEERYNRTYVIPIKDLEQVTEAEIQAAERELSEIARTITWKTSKTIFRDHKWLGVTRLVPDEPGLRPWKDIDSTDYAEADDEARQQRNVRRPLVVAIMHEYVTALTRYPKNSESHLRATFLAGYTMAHEIGHVVWHQDYNSTNYHEQGRDPWVGDGSSAELGSAFMSWVFGGFDPNIREASDIMFEMNLIWSPRPQMSWGRNRTLYMTEWSISSVYMEEILKDEEWTMLRQKNNTRKGFSRDFQNRFTPDTRNAASATRAEWSYGNGRGEWNATVFEDRRGPPEPRDPPITSADRNWLVAQRQPIFTKREDSGVIVEHKMYPRRARYDTLPVANLIEINMSNLPERLISDGALERYPHNQDLSAEKVTRVEVRYRANGAHNANIHPKKRPRSGDEDIEDDDKPHRASSYDPEDEVGNEGRDADKDERFGDEDYDCRDVVELLRHKSVESITTFTLVGAEEYCLTHNIPFRLKLPLDDVGQRQRLNEIQHRGLIERIRMFALGGAERRFLAVNDLQALVAIKQAKLASLRNWDDEDILQFANSTLGIIEDADANFNRVKRWLTDDLKDAQYKARLHNYNKEYTGLGESEDDPGTWDMQELQSYSRINKLPHWGDKKTITTRIARHQIEKAQGRSLSRKQINCDAKGPVRRTDADGIETYAWDVLLRFTSVEILKNELYRTAMLPSNCNLHLYFAKDQRNFLEDDRDLSYYDGQGVDWKDLWVILTIDESDADTAFKQTKAIYKARSLLDFGARRGSRFSKTNMKREVIESSRDYDDYDDDGSKRDRDRRPNTPIRSCWKRKRIVVDLTEDRDGAPAYLKRAKRIIDAPEERTIAELMESVVNGKAEIDRVFQPGAGFDLSLKVNGSLIQTSSGAEVIDNLTGLLQVEEDRKKTLESELAGVDERKELRWPGSMIDILKDDDDLNLKPVMSIDVVGKRTGESHMRDLYQVLHQPEVEEEEESSEDEMTALSVL